MDYRKVCSECNKPSDEFNTDVFGDVICGECGVQSHCFCEECDEYVPTSHCSVEDSVLDVDGMEIEESRVICNVCDENSDEPSTDPRGEENSKPKLLTLYGDKDSKYALEFMIDGNGGWKYQLYFYRENELIDQIGLKEGYLEKMLKFIKDNKEIK